jgi:molybdopterin synthase sulfur carrier subunit
MLIEVKLLSVLRQNLPSSSNLVEGDKLSIPEESTVAHVLEILNIPENESKVLLINGSHGKRESVLNEGDILSVFPPLAGG